MDSHQYQEIRESIRERLRVFRENADGIMEKCGRHPSELTLIGVSKFFPSEYARAATELGLKDLGENRVREMTDKQDVLSALGLFPNWHLIGTLQTNKVKYIVGRTSLIHSVDSLRLIDEISTRSDREKISTSILLQANISGEDSKHGFLKHELNEAVEYASRLPGICLCGLMTMAPVVPCEYSPRRVFEETSLLFEKIKNQIPNPESWKVLSMGMSQDYIDAIQCGATHIRIGTKIFGQRVP